MTLNITKFNKTRKNKRYIDVKVVFEALLLYLFLISSALATTDDRLGEVGSSYRGCARSMPHLTEEEKQKKREKENECYNRCKKYLLKNEYKGETHEWIKDLQCFPFRYCWRRCMGTLTEENAWKPSDE